MCSCSSRLVPLCAAEAFFVDRNARQMEERQSGSKHWEMFVHAVAYNGAVEPISISEIEVSARST
jgi:hypothetical protein